MAARILFVPTWRVSPIACRSLPGIRSLLDDLRTSFEVDVFTWPCIKGGPAVPATWQGAVDALAGDITSNTHLLSFGAATPIALMALTGEGHRARSLTSVGIAVPNATLLTLGLPDVAGSWENRARFSPTPVWLQSLLHGIQQDSIDSLAQRIDAEIDWGYLAQFQRSFETLDLVARRAATDVPVLYLSSPLDRETGEGIKDVFMRFAPEAATDDLQQWPANLESPDSGLELAARFRRFLSDVARERVVSTILFTDIVDSTVRAFEMGDAAWNDVIRQHNALIRRYLERFSGREVSTAGDGFFAVFDSPAGALRCALAASRQVRNLGIEIRAGLHTGEYEILGQEVGGVAINIAARVAARATASQVLVSDTVRQMMTGSEFIFEDRGTHVLKGVPEEWRIFALQG
ncbi:MAG: hypothetical protein GEU28_02210 [Dehalococcoidia bacterium]|nr:hypothetical protein [Dehalococcoidia bacterium]